MTAALHAAHHLSIRAFESAAVLSATGGVSGLAARVGRLASLGVGKARETALLFRRYTREIPVLGAAASTRLFLAELSSRQPLSHLVRRLAPRLVTMMPAGYRSPLTFRRTETDNKVIRQVIVREEYRDAAALRDIHLIVDCGANIGVTSYYLLHRYPDARLIAVEPDAENFELCRQNLAAFGARVTAVHAAIWPTRQPLRIAAASRADGAWALRVEPVEPEEAEVYGLPMTDILALASEPLPIDLLKMDIEGAEAQVFANECAPWLDATRHLVIELHGEAPRAIFDAALAPYACRRHETGELTVLHDLSPRRG